MLIFMVCKKEKSSPAMKSISLGRFLEADFEFHSPRAVGEIDFWASLKGAPIDTLLIPRRDIVVPKWISTVDPLFLLDHQS